MKIMSSVALSSFYGRRIADSSPSARNFELRKGEEMITKITIMLPFTFPYLTGEIREYDRPSAHTLSIVKMKKRP